MEIASVLPPETRIIDIGPPDASFASALAAQGFQRYLGLVEPTRLAGVRSAAGPLAHRFHELTSPELAYRNSADLLVLRARYGRALWTFRDLGHLRYVALERSAGSTGLEGALAALLGGATRKLGRRGRHTYGDLQFDLFEIPLRREPEPRTYASPVWGVEGLATRLKEAGLRYAVLRWFETLPQIDPGEDMDLLVADADIDALRALVEQEPGTIPLDLYSVSGLAYSDFRGAAYYPPAFAGRLIDRAVVHSSGFLVPAPDDHLHSLIYHAVYHKGYSSGLASERPVEVEELPEHDYRRVLDDLAAALGIVLPQTLEGLDEYLGTVGWRPPLDALRRLAASNSWVRSLHGGSGEASPDGTEVATFLVREQTLETMPIEDVLAVLEHFGFDVVHVGELSPQAREHCAHSMRGGNWGRGPFPRTGGEPVVAVVALHYAPDQPTGALRAQYPHLSNAETYYAKQRLRKVVEAKVAKGEEFNPIHSSDNETEAWEYVEGALPSALPEIRTAIEARRREFRTAGPVVRELSRGRRAKVEVVPGGADGLLVRKTYARGFLRFKDREVSAMDELSPRVAAVPRVVDTGPNWFTCAFYANRLAAPGGSAGRLIPLRAVRQMVAVLKSIYDLGYDLVDAKPDNFLLDPVEGLKVVDFEFLHRYPEDDSRPPFERSYNFVGLPEDYPHDRPVGDLSYDVRWYPATGLPLPVLVSGTLPAQVLHRTAYRARRATTTVGAPARRAARRALDSARRAKGEAGWQYTLWSRRRAASRR